MDQSNRDRSKTLIILTIVCLFAASQLMWFALSKGSADNFELVGLATANRTLNQLTGVVLTCIALIIPLTSNLYTPKLVKLYVTHPLIVYGLSFLIGSNLIVMTASLFPGTHPFFSKFWPVVIILFYLNLAGILPFLYAVSQFLRPSYFIPVLTQQGCRNIRKFNNDRKDHREIFETIDVLTNIALTGMNRKDRQLVLLAGSGLHQILLGMLESPNSKKKPRKERFVPGLAREGQDFLKRKGIWPEAYVLAQTLKVMELANQNQHEIVAEMASRLVLTADLCNRKGQEDLLELHVMIFNAIMRASIESKNLRTFQNLSYHYRLLVEVFIDAPARMQETAQHLVHYGRLAHRSELHFGLETVQYDLGELILNISEKSQNRASELLNFHAFPLWQRNLAQGNPMQRSVWRVIIRTFWEAKAAGYEQVADLIQKQCLQDDTLHREKLNAILNDNRELHWEFNDRLMRFAHISEKAEELAWAFEIKG